jgi:hypothetical protein
LATSNVLARRAPEAGIPLKQNAAAVELILKQEVFAGTAVTLASTDIAALACHLGIYEDPVHSVMNGQLAWRVRSGEMGAEQLGFLMLDYSQEREQLGLIEPDLRSTFRLARGVAETMHAYQTHPPRQATSVLQQGERPFDIFLSHNSRDKPVVRLLADSLEALGVKAWLDERELVPGRQWQDSLEEIIQQVKSAAVLFGPSGLGPWEAQEMRACLIECVERGLPVIPILLPAAPRKPQLPLFLKQFTWVDLRQGLDREGLNRIIWGITGTKPTYFSP